MKITEESRKWGKVQLERLSVFPAIEKLPEGGLREFIKQFIEMCPTEPDGEWLIDYAIKNEQFLPMPARLREILTDHRCKPDN